MWYDTEVGKMLKDGRTYKGCPAQIIRFVYSRAFTQQLLHGLIVPKCSQSTYAWVRGVAVSNEHIFNLRWNLIITTVITFSEPLQHNERGKHFLKM